MRLFRRKKNPIHQSGICEKHSNEIAHELAEIGLDRLISTRQEFERRMPARLNANPDMAGWTRDNFNPVLFVSMDLLVHVIGFMEPYTESAPDVLEDSCLLCAWHEWHFLNCANRDCQAGATWAIQESCALAASFYAELP
jgi:hypothetical protein